MIEDFIRFENYDEKILADIRNIRAKFYNLRKRIDRKIVLKRDSDNDPGRDYTYDKNGRKNFEDILRSSFGRCEESSRVIEEIFKVKDVKISKDFKEIRFKLYTLEKKVLKRLFKKRFPKNFGLYLIMTDPVVGYEKLSEIALKNKVKVIQLRDKKLSDKKILEIAKRIKSITKNSETLFIVDDRVDITLLSDADGVHVGQTDISVEDVRKFSENIIVGKSTHSILQLKKAIKENPDYVGIGPIYPTNSKVIKDRVLGLKKAKKMFEIASIPTVGIGGIKPDNLFTVLSQGFKNYAVLSYINESNDPSKRIKEFFDVERSYYEKYKIS
uniref:Thiamine-phosphate synthase n=1 Tax=candidate division WOR-3 bacterium TaxID=2052148 RepID=A0A7C3N5S8_UNCW3